MPDVSAQIQALIDQEGPGGRLTLPSGSFEVKELKIPDNFDLNGLNGTCLKLTPLETFDGSPILMVSGSNCTISNITFDGQRESHYYDGFSDSWDGGGLAKVGRSYRAAIIADGINSGTLDGLTVKNCYFTATHGAQIAARAINNVEIAFNSSSDCNFEFAYFSSTVRARNIHIHDNYISNLGITASELTGIPAVTGDAMIAGGFDNVVIERNIYDTITRASVKFGNGNNLIFRDNIVGRAGQFTDGRINGYPGVQFSGEVTNALIENNEFYECGNGIQIGLGTAVVNKNIKISNNRVLQTTGLVGAPDGIVVGGAPFQNLDISDNFITGSIRHGIYMGGYGEDISVKRNKIYHSGTTWTGIYLTAGSSSQRIEIEENTVRNFSNYGGGIGSIYVQNSAHVYTDLRISKNKILSTNTAIYASGTTFSNFYSGSAVDDNETGGAKTYLFTAV